jgi:UPF0755 protein
MLAGIGAASAYEVLAVVESPGRLAEPVDVVVPRGSLQSVAEILRRAGVIGGSRAFEVAAFLTAWQGKLRAAELTFPAHASLAQVLIVLRSGRAVQHKITIPEGLTSAQIGLIFGRANALDGAIELPAEGSVLPETYSYERGASVRSVLQRASAAMQRAVRQAWASRSSDLDIRSPRELVILASLVEKETHLPVERGLVARVFYNRLAHGMRLQSDPTTVYGESGGTGVLPLGLSRADLERNTPYNTYTVAGLPAGPICNPGAAALEAASHPSRTNALYFVADGTGGHVFADTLEEHLRNVKHYRALGR